MIVGLLELDAHPLEEFPAVRPRVEAKNGDAAVIRFFSPQDALDCGALSRAVGAQKPEHRAAVHGQAEAVHRCQRAVGFCELFYFDYFLHFITSL